MVARFLMVARPPIRLRSPTLLLPPPLPRPASSPHYRYTSARADATTVCRKSYHQSTALQPPCSPELQPATPPSTFLLQPCLQMLQPCSPELQPATPSSMIFATTMLCRCYHRGHRSCNRRRRHRRFATTGQPGCWNRWFFCSDRAATFAETCRDFCWDGGGFYYNRRRVLLEAATLFAGTSFRR